MTSEATQTDVRARRLSLLSRASLDELESAWEALAQQPSVETLRGPEVGLVMARGRMGGTGSQFNLGDVTIARATVKLIGGELGFGQVLASDKRRAWLCAVFDALAERDGSDSPSIQSLIEGVQNRLNDERQQEQASTASTRVDFFTVARGEDP